MDASSGCTFHSALQFLSEIILSSRLFNGIRMISKWVSLRGITSGSLEKLVDDQLRFGKNICANLPESQRICSLEDASILWIKLCWKTGSSVPATVVAIRFRGCGRRSSFVLRCLLELGLGCYHFYGGPRIMIIPWCTPFLREKIFVQFPGMMSSSILFRQVLFTPHCFVTWIRRAGLILVINEIRLLSLKHRWSGVRIVIFKKYFRVGFLLLQRDLYVW